MIVCLDVDYRGDNAVVAAIVFDKIDSDVTVESHTEIVMDIYPYVPGEFYKRELPCLMAALKKVQSPINLIIIDSYVWLAKEVPGMGHHLYEALDKKIPIIGCAKTFFKTDDISVKVYRGSSKNPLYVTSVGMDYDEAATLIGVMHGDNRLPTLLKKVDRLCRDVTHPLTLTSFVSKQ